MFLFKCYLVFRYLLLFGGYIAMIPFTAYDKQNTQAKQMTALLEKENAETNLKELEELKK